MQLILDTNGLTVKVQSRSFMVTAKRKGETIRRRISPKRVSSIAVTADCTISASAVRLAARNGIPIFYHNAAGKVEARMWSPHFGTIASLRRQQVRWGDTPLATAWVVELFRLKAERQATLLGWVVNRRPRLQADVAVWQKLNERTLTEMQSFAGHSIERARNNLMGLEGTLARSYWQILSKGLPTAWQFPTRSRRPAQDPFNALLNYAYGMLYALVENATFAAGLDPYLGVLHVDGHRRPAFVFDLIEPFRPWVDRMLIEGILQKKFSPDHVQPKGDGYWLNAAGKQRLIPEFYGYFRQRTPYAGKLLSRKNHVHRFCGLLATELREMKFYP